MFLILLTLIFCLIIVYSNIDNGFKIGAIIFLLLSIIANILDIIFNRDIINL